MALWALTGHPRRELCERRRLSGGVESMTEQRAQQRTEVGREEPSGGWAGGFTVFAGIMMIIVGLFHIAAGLAAIVENRFFVITPDYLYTFDVTGWGWIHLVGGFVVLLAGCAVFTGRLWARAVGIVLAGLSAIANFLFLPYYPLWSLLIIALDVFVIWALAVHGRRVPA
ncbi:hypothetical protein KZZ52_36535 [Dactylosporangium sp. AC04546]|uniref:DUF7144 family membrane protein n=1 Tax=Dactylosporangium sp. AC04546 TaxID=2862460 RepID=UPI001EE0D629|nr:hypothetical protein [Dactylosporangium sp. AC04546]WVK79474.1 hypothetical protein KZZ52_36535 [Dactylosporangium sp. AC04546]